MSGMSLRQQVAQNLADTCMFGELNDVYEVQCEKTTDAKGKAYWSVIFCKARTLDGAIRVYSPNFILISWQTAYRDMPSKGKEVFRSEATAREFIIKSFVKV